MVVITKDIYIRYVECTYVAKINALGRTLHSIRLYKHERTKSISDNQRLLFYFDTKWRLPKSESDKMLIKCYGF